MLILKKKEFMTIVNKMVENNCELPDEFDLSYRIMEYKNRSKYSIQIKESKYWYTRTYKVIDSGENYEIKLIY